MKKRRLWHYEDLIRKFLDVMALGFAKEYYSDTKVQAADYVLKTEQGYRPNKNGTVFTENERSGFKKLSGMNTGQYRELPGGLRPERSAPRFFSRAVLPSRH